MTPDTSIASSRQRTRRLAHRVALLAAAALLACAASAAAAPNPATNITPGPLPRACTNAPQSARCIAGVMTVLDRARAVIGLGPYNVPTDFAALPGADQLLILSNLDRIAYGLTPISGLVPALNTVAASGVSADTDPDPSAALSAVASFSWVSNWAGDYPNAPEAYYAWMYYDGWSGRQTSNLDCTSATASGCWGHRQDVLAFSDPGIVSMGAYVGRDAHGQVGYAMTLVWTPSSTWTNYTYTWVSAQADGAGTRGRHAAGKRRPQIVVTARVS